MADLCLTRHTPQSQKTQGHSELLPEEMEEVWTATVLHLRPHPTRSPSNVGPR